MMTVSWRRTELLSPFISTILRALQVLTIEEKSQQLKFRMQTEIQIDKHHALCQASDQLEELDYTKLYFAYSGIRKSQIEPRVLFKVLVCAYIYAKETRTEVREGRCGFRL